MIELAGDVNRGAEEALEAACTRATASGADAVVLDFAAVGYINSTGIALIVGLLAERASERHRRAGVRPVRALPGDLRDHAARRTS